MNAPADSLSLKAYQHIHRKLLAGDWVAGDVLSEVGVAQELGISRTPVREAFRNLEQEGVLEPVPRFGTRVKALDRRDMQELYELREALEPYAVYQAAGKLSMGEVKVLQALCEELKQVAEEMRGSGLDLPDNTMMRRLMTADMSFHQLLIRAAGNRRMLKIVSESRMLARIFGTSRQEHDLGVIDETFGYHQEILAAVAKGEAGKARDLMTTHIQASMRGALEHFDRRMAEAGTRSMSLGLPEDMLEDLEKIKQQTLPTRVRSKRSRDLS